MRRAGLAMVLCALFLLTACGGDPVRIDGEVTMTRAGSNDNILSHACVCDTVSKEGVWSDDRFAGEQVAFSVASREECITTMSGERKYTATASNPDTEAASIAGTNCRYQEDQLGTVTGFGAVGEGDEEYQFAVVRAEKPLDIRAPSAGRDIVLHAAIACGNQWQTTSSQHSAAIDSGATFTEGDYAGCLQKTGTVASDFIGTIRAEGRLTTDYVDSAQMYQAEGGYYRPHGWFSLQQESYALPLPAKCSSYELRTQTEYVEDPDQTTAFEKLSTSHFAQMQGSDGEQLRVEIFEAVEQVPDRIEVSYNDKAGNSGLVAYAIICKNPLIDPQALESTCTTAPTNGAWTGDFDNGACCYADTIGQTTTPDTGVYAGQDVTCFDLPSGYEWRNSIIKDNPSCDGGTRDGLETDASVCCESGSFEPVYDENQPYFCNDGTIYDGSQGIQRYEQQDPWAWSGDTAIDEQGSWLECDGQAVVTAHGKYLCVEKQGTSDFETCRCDDGISYDETCGPARNAEGWYCAPGATEDANPFWTEDPSTEGACMEDQRVNDICCNPGRYDIEQAPVAGGDGLLETIGCYNGVKVNESDITPARVQGVLSE